MAGFTGSGAPVNAPFSTIYANASLTAERVLTEGQAIDIRDMGSTVLLTGNVASYEGLTFGTPVVGSLYHSDNQVYGTTIFGLGNSNTLVVSRYSSRNIDHSHTNETNPLLAIHDASDKTVAANKRKYIGLQHDGTDGRIVLGTGGLRVFSLLSSERLRLTNDGILHVFGVGAGAGTIKLYSKASTYSTGWASPQVLSADLNYTLPSAQGAANSILSNNGSGTTAWSSLATLMASDFKTIYKSATETITDGTMQNDDELLFTVAANEKWEADFWIRYSTSDTVASPNMLFDITVPSGTVTYWLISPQTFGLIAAAVQVATASGADLTAAGDGAGGSYGCTIHLSVSVGETGGTVQLRWAPSVVAGVSSTKVYVGSSLRAQRIA